MTNEETNELVCITLSKRLFYTWACVVHFRDAETNLIEVKQDEHTFNEKINKFAAEGFFRKKYQYLNPVGVWCNERLIS